MTYSPPRDVHRELGKGVRKPPGPKGLPLLGNMLDLAKDQLGFFANASRDYGDLVAVNLAGWPTLVVSDMAAIETILVKEHRNFVKNELIWRHVTALFGEGLLTSNGELWQRQRRIAAPAFAGQQLLSYDSDIVDLTEQMLSGWRDGQVFDVHPEMMGLALRIAAKAFFASEVEQDVVEMDHAANELVAVMESRFTRPIKIPDFVPLPGNLRYRKAIRSVEKVVARMIDERRNTTLDGRMDFLSRMMAAQDASGRRLSDKLLRDEAVTLLLAGHETTALALSWTFFLLGQHRDVFRAVSEEVAQVVGDRRATSDDLPHLKFTESVIMEAMRLYPPAWVIGRESVGPFELSGYRFPARTTIFISQWFLHRDPRYFEEPETFRPERWMGDLARELPRFAYMPFGGGPRICIGQRFALNEAILILATIARRYSATWQTNRPVTPFPSITLRPKGGVWVELQQRPGAMIH